MRAKRAKIPYPVLMLVTDRQRAAGRAHDGEEGLDDIARDAALNGVNVVQLREKDLDTARLVAVGLHVKAAITDRALLFVNGDLEAARTLRADGVHLPERGPSVAEVRALLGEHVLVSTAVHDLTGALAAERAGADLLVLGTAFETISKPGITPLGPEGVREVCAAVQVPVIAIGGITAANAGDVMRAGAAGVAVIGAIMDAADPRAAAKALRGVIDSTALPR
jgi:thiamine-phosphate diphosphorylase